MQFRAIMISELTESAERIESDRSARVVVLAARGKSFCAGADLNWMKAPKWNSSSKDPPRGGASVCP